MMVASVTAAPLAFCYGDYCPGLLQVNRHETQDYVVLGIKERQVFSAECISHGASQRIEKALFLLHTSDTCHPGCCHWFEAQLIVFPIVIAGKLIAP